MAITTASESKVFICSTPWTSALEDATDYAALTWIEIGEVEDMGEFGDESSDVTFASVGDGRTRHLKGVRDAGTLALVCGRDPLDAGQVALKAAEKTKFSYPIKVQAADAISADYSDSVYYFGAKVMSARDNYGSVDNVVRTNFSLGIDTEIIEVPSEDTTP
ncbi:iron ABC transporter substrate-binding protein [Shinella sp. JR1-6]|uniref:iron ABC transporter substrate-binding protein n=1 Tax=Shinella sp. JR1-6 TaxID=2527671 RepID=UPI00102D39C9|nr:iron ABC transporter substrate-binding protein [Shinella sp. JR1-6]TAA54016.1 iron ABC transporter substrate-binding protein [Shinella sp. JR1-6]